MSDETKRVIFWVLGIALFMVFYLIIMAVVGFVKGSGGVDSMLSITGWVVLGLIILGALMAFMLLFARFFHMGARLVIESQQSDDRGEIARMAMRNLGQGDKQAMQMASRMAIELNKASNRQLPIAQEVEPEYADYWPLPQLEDEQHELAR
jgi:type VI protein secretion system component VasK